MEFTPSDRLAAEIHFANARESDLMLPYGMSDGAVGIAVVCVPDLLTALRASP